MTGRASVHCEGHPPGRGEEKVLSLPCVKGGGRGSGRRDCSLAER